MQSPRSGCVSGVFRNSKVSVAEGSGGAGDKVRGWGGQAVRLAQRSFNFERKGSPGLPK